MVGVREAGGSRAPESLGPSAVRWFVRSFVCSSAIFIYFCLLGIVRQRETRRVINFACSFFGGRKVSLVVSGSENVRN